MKYGWVFRARFIIACLLGVLFAAEVFARGGGGGRGGGGSVARSGSYGSVRQSASQSRTVTSARDVSYDGVRDGLKATTLPAERPIRDGRWGDHVTTLPADRVCVRFGNVPYYYYGGHYYIDDDNGYSMVEPPAGAVIYELPDGAKVVVVNGVSYFTDGTTYYRSTYVNGQVAYMVVPSPK